MFQRRLEYDRVVALRQSLLGYARERVYPDSLLPGEQVAEVRTLLRLARWTALVRLVETVRDARQLFVAPAEFRPGFMAGRSLQSVLDNALREWVHNVYILSRLRFHVNSTFVWYLHVLGQFSVAVSHVHSGAEVAHVDHEVRRGLKSAHRKRVIQSGEIVGMATLADALRVVAPSKLGEQTFHELTD